MPASYKRHQKRNGKVKIITLIIIMNIFSSSILEEYLKEYNQINEDIHIYESEETDGNVRVEYRIGEYEKYENKDKKTFIPITDLIDFIFMKFKKLEEMLNNQKYKKAFQN